MKVVFTAAIMDLCHRGHLNLLKNMREAGDKVVVILHDDKSCYQIKGKIPIQTIEQRVNNLWITGLVDDVRTINDVSPAEMFQDIVEDYIGCEFLFMRGDDNNDGYPGKWFIDENNIQTKFIKYTEGVSSSKIREDLINDKLL